MRSGNGLFRSWCLPAIKSATTRTPDKVTMLRAQGAEPVVVDGPDRNAVMRAVVSSHPEVIVHQMTALASMRSLKHFDDQFAPVRIWHRFSANVASN